MLLYLIRHGDPIYDPDSLTPLGEEQAKALAKRLALYGLDEIYASTSNRAQLTAKPTCELLKKEMKLVDWANEAHAWQDFTAPLPNGNRTWAFWALKEKFRTEEVRNLGAAWYTHPCFEGNFDAGVRRINAETDAFLKGLGYEHDRANNRYECVEGNDRRVALFAHQGFGLAFLSSVLDIPYPVFSTSFDLSHSSMTVISFEKEKDKPFVYPKVLQLSNDSHLYKEGILTGYNNGKRV